MANPLDVDNLKAELGGKPVWFWGLLGGVFVLALYYVFKSKKAATVAGSMATGQGTVADTLNAAYPTVDPNLAGGVYSAPDQTNALGGTTLETKESWVGRAVVIGARYNHSGLYVTNVLNKYFAGTPLTEKEAATVNQIIGAIGLPPGGQNKVVQIIKTVATPDKTNKTVNNTTPKTVVPTKPKTVTPAKPKVIAA